MPAPKAHRAANHLRTHSRSSSATKVTPGHLHFTHKDPRLAQQDKAKKAPYGGAHEPHQRSTSPYARASSQVHVQHTNQMPAVAVRREQAPAGKQSTKGKAGFTLAGSGGDEDDEDDWVSSGAATPSGADGDSDADDGDPSTPVDRSPPTLADHIEVNFRTTLPPPPARRADSPPSSPPDSITQLRTIPRSPTRRHPAARPPSTRSTRSDIASIRPHPLFRGQSYGPARPVPLAPLTITDDCESPASPASASALGRAASPTPSLVDSAPSPRGLAHPDRRTSVSSARSVATLPVQPLSREKEHRSRTLSTMSTSSSSAALSSLAHLPAVSRPPSPKQVYFFPVANPHVNLDAIHPLLPSRFLRAHLTTLATRHPLLESYQRVLRAKQGF